MLLHFSLTPETNQPKQLWDDRKRRVMGCSLASIMVGVGILLMGLPHVPTAGGKVMLGMAAVPMTAGLVGLSTIILQAVSRVRQDMNEKCLAKDLTKRLTKGKQEILTYQSVSRGT